MRRKSYVFRIYYVFILVYFILLYYEVEQSIPYPIYIIIRIFSIPNPNTSNLQYKIYPVKIKINAPLPEKPARNDVIIASINNKDTITS